MRRAAFVILAFLVHAHANAQVPVSVYLLDGSIIRCFTVTESLAIDTHYGPLVIPFANITRVKFALRADNLETKQLIEARRKLDSQVFLDREIAKKMFTSLGRLSIPTLLAAAKSTDRDTSINANLLLKSITETDSREVIEFDAIETALFPAVGNIVAESLTFRSPTLGKLVVPIGKINRVNSDGI